MSYFDLLNIGNVLSCIVRFRQLYQFASKKIKKKFWKNNILFQFLQSCLITFLKMEQSNENEKKNETCENFLNDVPMKNYPNFPKKKPT